MRTSSARQLEFNLDGDDLLSANVARLKSPEVESSSATSSVVNFPNFGNLGEAYAVTSRLAGRINAASVSDKEHSDLLKERQSLLDRLFAKEITRKEQLRLEYVRWSLDRIEDAKHGYVLDALESAVGTYERFLSQIEGFQTQLDQAINRKRR